VGIVEYLRKLEEVLIRACADYGVLTQRAAGRAGVWTMPGGAVAEKKIAALGVHVSRGVTSHGFALNVTTDLAGFDLIVPCGIRDRGVTSMEVEVDLHPAPSLEQMANSVARHFARVFARPVVWVESLDDLLPGGLPPARISSTRA
jgi:lipoyl(octanoyl) transferase